MAKRAFFSSLITTLDLAVASQPIKRVTAAHNAVRGGYATSKRLKALTRVFSYFMLTLAFFSLNRLFHLSGA